MCGLVERNKVVGANETHPEDAVEDDEDVFEEEEATACVVLSGHAHSSVARRVHGGALARLFWRQGLLLLLQMRHFIEQTIIGHVMTNVNKQHAHTTRRS